VRVAPKLTAGIDPTGWRSWIAGRPFEPFFFWNNSRPRSFEARDAIQQQIGSRGWVVTFDGDFHLADSGIPV
jgi:hypothetical protein